MKLYFVLLAVLFLSSALMRLMGMAAPTALVMDVKYLADIVLFGGCLAAAYGQAFGKELAAPRLWGWVGRLTLAMGVVTVVLASYGSSMGFGLKDKDILSTALDFLPYVLFAIPAVIYENDLVKRIAARGKNR